MVAVWWSDGDGRVVKEDVGCWRSSVMDTWIPIHRLRFDDMSTIGFGFAMDGACLFLALPFHSGTSFLLGGGRFVRSTTLKIGPTTSPLFPY